QVLAYETDLLEYGDLFDGSHVVEAKTAELEAEAGAELEEILAMGGAFEALEEMKARLVSSQAARLRRIESGEQIGVGGSAFTESGPSPLGGDEVFLRVDPAVENEMAADVAAWRAGRSAADVRRALDDLRGAAQHGENVMPATVALAEAGGTTGEWGA